MAEMRVVLAAVAAIVGAGFASGREIASFFTNQGAACWAGVAVCCALSGAAVAMLVQLAARTNARTLPQLYALVMDERCGEAMQVAYTLLLAVVTASMLSAAGELGALALYSPFARAAGVACALALGLLAAKGGRSLSIAGMAVAVMTLAFYCALCFAPADAEFVVRGSPAVSTALGALYAALNIALAGGVICSVGRHCASPLRAGVFTALALAALLIPACIALQRLNAPDAALPSVALASRLGMSGFVMGLVMLFTGVVTTLAATLHCLREQLMLSGLPARACMPVAIACGLLLSIVGFAPIVDIGYPLLGFLCAMVLPALAFFL